MERDHSKRGVRVKRSVCAARMALLVALGALSSAVHAARVSVTIEGLDAALRDAARAGLELARYTDREVTPAQIRRLHARGEEQIRRALEPYGYYSARIDSRIEQQGERYEVVFKVAAGEPVRIEAVDIRVEGSGGELPAVRAAIERFEPSRGDPLDHSAYEASKTAVQSALLSAGFLDAETTRHRVEVTRGAGTANIDLAWQSGERYRFGEVRFSESQFEPLFLQRYVPWTPGDYYSADQLLALQQRLIDADYFSIVAVQPDRAGAASATVPIEVTLTPAKRSVYSGGLYLSTDSGPGVRLGFERRWLNRRGHKLSADLEGSQRLQAASTNYRIPLPGPDDRRFNFGVAYRDEETDSSVSQTLRLAANEARLWRGFTRTLGLQFLSGDFEVGSERGNSTLLYPEAVLAGKRADDLYFPRAGWSLTVGARIGQEGLVSDTSFAQVFGDAKWIRGFGERQRLIVRGSAGAMIVDDFSELPPELRFFAGGDRSVRGYDYKSIGTTNALGEVIGGEFLAVGSAEYEYYFLDKWGAAVFVDAGDAFRAGEFELNTGVGLGLRWKSPVGVVRVDFGRAVGSELGESFRLHIVIGPDL